MKKIAMIATGGQTGVERAALDFARKNELPVIGWCPKRGWAEDMPDAPGIRELFPELREIPFSDSDLWARWNVRDSSATLLIHPRKGSSQEGTSIAAQAAREMQRPLLEVWGRKSAPEVVAWLQTLGKRVILNVAGPTASECPKAYKMAEKILGRTARLLKKMERREGVEPKGDDEGEEEVDPKFVEALKVVIKEGKATVSLIQRNCEIGYAHAGQILGTMERMGYVAPFEGSAQHTVLITKEDFIAKYGEWD